MNREILHIDMNSFYVSVELIDKPELLGKAVAVGGNEEKRHGIILAKSPLAKSMGVKTGEPIWEARKKCPNLIILPPDYEKYVSISKKSHEIYYSYTNYVEPYGMDECWLDITGSDWLFGSGLDIAKMILERVKDELKVTVSIGLSYNKVFAKMGSDLANRDDLAVVTPYNYKSVIWPLKVEEMIMIGRKTKKKLNSIGIYTLGQLANTNPDLLKNLLGVNGVRLWQWANGRDESKVLDYKCNIPIKSIGKSITCCEDLINNEEVKSVIQKLAQEVSRRLILNKYLARGINIAYRNTDLATRGYDVLLDYPTNSSLEISRKAIETFIKNHNWDKKVRAIYLRAIKLTRDRGVIQDDFFYDKSKSGKFLNLENTIYTIREKHGKESITYGNLTGDLKMPDDGRDIVMMPNSFI